MRRALLIALLGLAACDNPPAGGRPDGAIGDGGSDDGGWTDAGPPDAGPPTGTLSVQISGPDGGPGEVTVTGPNGFVQNLGTSATFPGLPLGAYTAVAHDVRVPGAVVDTVYAGQLSGNPAQVASATTATLSIDYAPGYGSGQLWIPGCYEDALVAYTAAHLATGGASTPDLALVDAGLYDPDSGQAACPGAVALDGQGNLWLTLLKTDAVWMIPSGALAGGNALPTVVLVAPPAPTDGGVQPLSAPVGLAFDPNGDLWVAGGNNLSGWLAEYTPAQLVASGAPQPHAVLADLVQGSTHTLQSLFDIAFDQNGSLWVSSYLGKTVSEFGQVETALGLERPLPAVVLSDAVTGGQHSLCGPQGLAFDRLGNLWVSNFCNTTGNIARFDAAQLGQSGAPAPAAILTSPLPDGGSPQIGGIAFDNAGDLWAVSFAHSIFRLPSPGTAVGVSVRTASPVFDGTVSVDLSHPAFIPFTDGGTLFP